MFSTAKIPVSLEKTTQILREGRMKELNKERKNFNPPIQILSGRIVWRNWFLYFVSKQS